MTQDFNQGQANVNSFYDFIFADDPSGRNLRIIQGFVDEMKKINARIYSYIMLDKGVPCIETIVDSREVLHPKNKTEEEFLGRTPQILHCQHRTIEYFQQHDVKLTHPSSNIQEPEKDPNLDAVLPIERRTKLYKNVLNMLNAHRLEGNLPSGIELRLSFMNEPSDRASESPYVQL